MAGAIGLLVVAGEHVADDADDREPRLLAARVAEANALADRALVLEELRDELAVDDRHRQLAGAVADRERAAVDDAAILSVLKKSGVTDSQRAFG